MLVIFGLEDVKVILKDVGAILVYSSAIFLVPLAVMLLYQEDLSLAYYFLLPAAITFLVGIALRTFFATKASTEMRHALAITGLAWLLFTVFASLPFVFIMGMPLEDAFFETMSALTTTGLSIMKPLLDSTPFSLLFWRSLISWVGGVGIIVLAMVGILSSYSRASKLIVAEGRKERLTPNLKNSIKEVWAIYLGLTLFGAFALYVSGMNAFDSVNYSMSAISTTGMDVSQQGLSGGNTNVFINLFLVVIMVLGATSFSVHYLFFKKNRWNAYLQDSEFKVLMFLGIFSALLVVPKLGLDSAFFHVFSGLTCGGFEISGVLAIKGWDEFTKFLFIFLMFVGGSSSSTAGGIKMSRFIIFAKTIYWKVREVMLPPKSFFSKRFEGRELAPNEIKEVLLFIMFYLFFVLLGVAVVTFNGASLADAGFEVVSAQSNAGLSVGITGPEMPLGSKLVLTLNMWVGRLEIIPLFSLLGLLYSARLRRPMAPARSE